MRVPPITSEYIASCKKEATGKIVHGIVRCTFAVVFAIGACIVGPVLPSVILAVIAIAWMIYGTLSLREGVRMKKSLEPYS